jgi:hypothetical protein
MFAVRSAIFLVALACAISPSPVSASYASASAAGRVCLSFVADASIDQPEITLLSETPKVSPRTSRRPRLKAVLEEETDRKPEEIDLGRIPAPRTPGLRASIAVSSPFYPRTSRLRC